MLLICSSVLCMIVVAGNKYLYIKGTCDFIALNVYIMRLDRKEDVSYIHFFDKNYAWCV